MCGARTPKATTRPRGKRRFTSETPQSGPFPSQRGGDASTATTTTATGPADRFPRVLGVLNRLNTRGVKKTIIALWVMAHAESLPRRRSRWLRCNPASLSQFNFLTRRETRAEGRALVPLASVIRDSSLQAASGQEAQNLMFHQQKKFLSEEFPDSPFQGGEKKPTLTKTQFKNLIFASQNELIWPHEHGLRLYLLLIANNHH